MCIDGDHPFGVRNTFQKRGLKGYFEKVLDIGCSDVRCWMSSYLECTNTLDKIKDMSGLQGSGASQMGAEVCGIEFGNQKFLQRYVCSVGSLQQNLLLFSATDIVDQWTCGMEPEDCCHEVMSCTEARSLCGSMREHWDMPSENLLSYMGKNWVLFLLDKVSEPTRENCMFLWWRTWHLKNDCIFGEGDYRIDVLTHYLSYTMSSHS